MTPTRKAILPGLIALIIILVFAGAASAGPIAAKKARLQAVQAQLEKVYEQSDMAVERYNEAASRLETVQERIARNRQLLKTAEYKLGVANQHLTARARQAYKANEAGIVDVLFASRTFDELVTQLDMMQRMAESDADIVHAAAAYRQEIADRRIALEADRQSAVKLVAQREASKDQVLALQSQLEGTAGGLRTRSRSSRRRPRPPPRRRPRRPRSRRPRRPLHPRRTARRRRARVAAEAAGPSSTPAAPVARPSSPSPSAISACRTCGAAPARAASTAPASPCTATRRSASASRMGPPTSSARARRCR